MKKKLATTALASVLWLSPLYSYAHADSQTVEKSNSQTSPLTTNHDTTTSENFSQAIPTIIAAQNLEDNVVYSESVVYDEKGNVVDRQVSGTEAKPSSSQGLVIADGSFNWKYVGSRESSNRINRDSYNVALILTGAFSGYLPGKLYPAIAKAVAGGLMYFNQPSLYRYYTDNYRDFDAVNEYVKSVTVTKSEGGTRLYSDTKVQKFVIYCIY